MALLLLANSVFAAYESQRMLDIAKKDMSNYLSTCKLMAAEWVKS